MEYPEQLHLQVCLLPAGNAFFPAVGVMSKDAHQPSRMLLLLQTADVVAEPWLTPEAGPHHLSVDLTQTGREEDACRLAEEMCGREVVGSGLAMNRDPSGRAKASCSSSASLSSSTASAPSSSIDISGTPSPSTAIVGELIATGAGVEWSRESESEEERAAGSASLESPPPSGSGPRPVPRASVPVYDTQMSVG